jgi:hypothetical protein
VTLGNLFVVAEVSPPDHSFFLRHLTAFLWFYNFDVTPTDIDVTCSADYFLSTEGVFSEATAVIKTAQRARGGMGPPPDPEEQTFDATNGEVEISEDPVDCSFTVNLAAGTLLRNGEVRPAITIARVLAGVTSEAATESVPEPATVLLMSGGLTIALLRSRRRDDSHPQARADQCAP